MKCLPNSLSPVPASSIKIVISNYSIDLIYSQESHLICQYTVSIKISLFKFSKVCSSAIIQDTLPSKDHKECEIKTDAERHMLLEISKKHLTSVNS
jgi:hypothetical protein